MNSASIDLIFARVNAPLLNMASAVKLKGKANWDSTIPTNAADKQADLNWKIECPPNEHSGNAVFFRCPNCPHVESSWDHHFQYTDLDGKIVCNKCRTMSSITVWRCICERYWHRCPLHRGLACMPEQAGTMLKTRKQTSHSASGQKRARPNNQVGPDSHEWLLAQDKAIEKRKREAIDEWDEQPTIVLGFPIKGRLKPAFLAPSIKRRFLDG